MVIEALEHRYDPAAVGLEERDTELREALEDAARGERCERGDHVDGIANGIVELAVFYVRVRTDEDADEAELLHAAPELAHRTIHVLEGDGGDAEEPLRVCLAVVGEPVVVCVIDGAL